MTQATQTIVGLRDEQRSGMILLRGHQILDSLTGRQRALPAAHDFHDLLMSSAELEGNQPQVLTVAPMTEPDLPALVDLLEEMDRFYGVTEFEPAGDRQAQIKALILRDPPAAHVLLARDADRVVGLASYSFLWPAVGLTQSLFLKELYAAEAYRRRGVGRLLMRRLFELAAETGCSRVEWMTEQANAEAQLFYAELGHKPNTKKVFYRVQGNPSLTMTSPTSRRPPFPG